MLIITEVKILEPPGSRADLAKWDPTCTAASNPVVVKWRDGHVEHVQGKWFHGPKGDVCIGMAANVADTLGVTLAAWEEMEERLRAAEERIQHFKLWASMVRDQRSEAVRGRRSAEKERDAWREQFMWAEGILSSMWRMGLFRRLWWAIRGGRLDRIGEEGGKCCG